MFTTIMYPSTNKIRTRRIPWSNTLSSHILFFPLRHLKCSLAHLSAVKSKVSEIYPNCSVTKSCLILCNPTDCSTPGLPEFVKVHVHWIGDASQTSPCLLLSSPFASNLSQHQSLFQWVGCSHQVAKVLELQRQSFQWVFRVDFP